MPAQKLNLQIGEEVDFYRAPGQKDTPGWSGPAEVIDVSKANRGVIVIKWQSRPLDVQLPNMRRHLHFLSLLTAQEDINLAFPSVYGNVWSAIRNAVDMIPPGAFVQVGFHRHND